MSTAPETSTVLIAGYYGFGNTGDEAILAAMLSDLRRRRPDLECAVVSGDPADTAARHGVRSLLWTDVPAILEAAERSDLIVLGGGGVFHDYWGARGDTLLTRGHGGIPYYSGFPFLGTLTDRPCMLYAVGVGPLLSDEGKSLTRLAFEHADLATVRDPESRDLLVEIGVPADRIRLTADPAFGLAADPGPAPEAVLDARRRRKGPVVGVCLRNWDVDVWPETWQPQVAAALDEFVETRDGSLVLVPFQARADHPLTDDLAVAEAVIGRMRRADAAQVLRAPSRPDEIAGVLAHCDLVVGMRLHALIFAVSAGVPSVALVYDPKVASLMARVGLGAYALDLPGLASSGLYKAMDEAWTHRDELRRGIAAATGELKRLAEENAELAVGLLEARPGRSGDVALIASVKRYAVLRTRQLADWEERVEALTAQVGERDRELATLRAQLALIMGSLPWRLVQDLRSSVLAVAPPGSLRNRTIRAFARVVGVFGRQGFAAFLAAVGTELAKGARTALRQLARPRGIFIDRLASENNRQVTLYTDDPALLPAYRPRRSLRDRGRAPVVVSLIATARNEGENARRWFDDLMKQTRLPDEVVVVDAGSTDGTFEVLSTLAGQSAVPFHVLSRPGANIASGRNLAISRARGAVIASTDFGCRLRSTWLERLIAPFEDDADLQVVAGWYEARPGGRRWWPSLRDVRPETFLPSSRSIAFTRDAWATVGGYPEWLTLTGEDTYLDLELQQYCPRWAFVPDAVVDWDAPATLTGYWRKVHGWTVGDGESGARSPHYWRSLLRLVARLVAVLMVAAGAGGLLLGLSPTVAASLMVAAALPVAALARWVGWRAIRLDEIGAEVAAVAGFVRGAGRRHEVARRRREEIRGVFLILSGVPIDDTGGGARCTQLALELLRQKFAVVFINRFPKHETADLNLRIRHPNLISCSLADFDWDRRFSAHRSLLEEKRLAGIVEFPLADFLPVIAAIQAHGGVVAYDLIDDWDTALGADWYSPVVERQTVAASQVLVATAGSLAMRLRRLSGRPVTLLPNAVNVRLFDRHRQYPRPLDLPAAEWIVTYVGALWGSWFDWDLLVEIARRYRDAAVVVIGDYRGQCPHPPANLHFLGLKPQRELPAYLAHTSVAIIPWKVDAITRATSPVKVYEYVAMAKPVVAPDLPTLAGIPLVLRSADRAGFVGNVERARHGLGEGQALDAFLRQNSWEARVEELVRILGQEPTAGPAGDSR
jgi:polysaccharide pyruvyl transferase CsaB